MSDVAAILLAAGRGTRFGEEPKLLAKVGGKALVRHAADFRMPEPHFSRQF